MEDVGEETIRLAALKHEATVEVPKVWMSVFLPFYPVSCRTMKQGDRLQYIEPLLTSFSSLIARVCYQGHKRRTSEVMKGKLGSLTEMALETVAFVTGCPEEVYVASISAS